MVKYRTDPRNILRSVDIVTQVMVKAAHRYDGLFPAVAERHVGRVLMDFPLPPAIPGQRNSDRAPRGCNLQHDIPLLEMLDGLDKALGRKRYTLQREAYLRTFATVCAAASPTGLLPWGEHAFWDLQFGVIGNSYLLQYADQPLDAGIPTHQQLFRLPFSQWEIIHEANPEVLPRFVDGLDWHWMDEARTQFNRHAQITQYIRGYQIKRHCRQTGVAPESVKGSDFPGASGMFIHDYACALALVDDPDPAWREALVRFSDSWWDRRLESGVCPKSGDTKATAWNGVSLKQTLSLASSLLSAGKVLRAQDPDLAETCLSRGISYVDAIFEFEQPDAEAGRLYSGYNPDGTPFAYSQLWAGNRGQPNTARCAIDLLNAADAADNSKGIELVMRAARGYLESFIPRDVIVRAGDPGAVIALTGEMYRLTGDQVWLDAALQHATDAMELYFDCPLPRMSTGRKHYESQQGSSALVHALARLVLIAEGRECVGGLARPMVQ